MCIYIYAKMFETDSIFIFPNSSLSESKLNNVLQSKYTVRIITTYLLGLGRLPRNCGHE